MWGLPIWERKFIVDAKVRLKLDTAIIKYDERQKRGKYYNPYAFAQYCGALQRVERYVDNGADLRLALLNCFQGRLVDALLRAVELPVTTKDECKYGGFERLPEIEENEQDE